MVRLCHRRLLWLLYEGDLGLELWPHPLSICFHRHLVRVVLCRLRPLLCRSLYQQLHHLNHRHLPLLLCQWDLQLQLLHRLVRLCQPSLLLLLLLLLQLWLLQLSLFDNNNKLSHIQAVIMENLQRLLRKIKPHE